jgi:hypothetical protein
MAPGTSSMVSSRAAGELMLERFFMESFPIRYHQDTSPRRAT